MPMRQYLQGHRFDAETARLLGIAFEMAIVTLQRADGVVSTTRDAVARNHRACEGWRARPGATLC
jgi:hypothetical protein